MRDYFLTYAAPRRRCVRVYAELKALRAAARRISTRSIPTAMVMAEMAKPRDTFMLARGDYRNQTEKVQPGVPAMLPPLPKDAPLNRLDAGASGWSIRQHPLTARVAVNRYWQTVLRHRPRQDRGGFRRRRATPPVASRAARLAGDRVRPNRTGTSRRCSA